MNATEKAGCAAALQAIHELAEVVADEDARPWLSGYIASRVLAGHPDQDAVAMRMLAGRIATGPPPQSSDPMHELADFARTVGSIASAASTLIARWNDGGDLEAEQVTKVRETVQSLVTAARGLDEISGWF